MEWEGEIWWWITTQPDAGRGVWERLALVLHCAGAIVDGLCLWVEDEDRRSRSVYDFRHRSSAPLHPEMPGRELFPVRDYRQSPGPPNR